MYTYTYLAPECIYIYITTHSQLRTLKDSFRKVQVSVNSAN